MPPIRLHDDDVLFREAVALTATRTGFAARLIEKDYFCTVALQHLSAAPGLVFKGGTCLAKVHAGFYRLSEDLDFVIPVDDGTPRAARKRAISAAQEVVSALAHVSGFQELQAPTGANESTQYAAVVGYTSRLGGHTEPIAVEISLREPLLMPAIIAEAQTLLMDPVDGRAWTPPVAVACMAQREAMAEKVRAALTRREPAIRDFFDVDYAVRAGTVDVHNRALLDLVAKKLVVVGNPPVDVTPARMAALRPQVDAQLLPVLRAADFNAFDLDRAFEILVGVAAALA